MITLVLLSLAIFLAYLIPVIREFGIPDSLSDTYYLLGKSSDPRTFNRLKASLFTAMMWVIAILLMVPLLDVTPELGKPLAFLSLAAIMFVGAAPEFQEDMEGKVHTIAAWVAAVLGIAWAVLFAHGFAWLAISFISMCVAANMTKTEKSSLTFWLEMVAFCTVFISAIFMVL